MTASPEFVYDSPRPKPAPVEYAGQWVAWNKRRTEIVAYGKELGKVQAAAAAAGHADAILQKVRRPDRIFIGAG